MSFVKPLSPKQERGKSTKKGGVCPLFFKSLEAAEELSFRSRINPVSSTGQGTGHGLTRNPSGVATLDSRFRGNDNKKRE